MLGALGGTAQTDAHREAVEKGIVLPPESELKAWAEKGEHYRRVIDIITSRANWARAVAALDERTGLWQGVLEVRVVFRKLEQPAMGNGKGGRGEIAMDLDRLAAYEKRIIDYERARDRGGIVVVPPARTNLILHHELTHCFQDMKQPLWFLEGLATYVARDGHFVAFFRNDGAKVRDVDADYEHKHVYARGWVFFEYVRAKHGEAAVKKLVALAVAEGKPAQEAAAEAAGLSWEALKAQEREWSARWVASYKVPK